jgi:hypothetical protein
MVLGIWTKEHPVAVERKIGDAVEGWIGVVRSGCVAAFDRCLSIWKAEAEAEADIWTRTLTTTYHKTTITSDFAKNIISAHNEDI